MLHPPFALRLAGALTLALAVPPAEAATVDTIARQAILVDTSTDTVLMEKNADERMPTSSMSKMMTAFLVYRALDEGRITLESRLPVSEKAWRMEGSKMWVDIGDSVRVEDLLRGLLIQSGNDAAIVLAEGLEGSEAAFAEKMNETAQVIGMTNSHFVNASGWPDPEHYSTARDLALLAQTMIERFPQYYRYDAETEFTWNGIKQGNRNPLLYRDMGVDGIKTGHTEEAGYGLTASGVRDGRRLVLVTNGLPSMQSRADEPARLLEWGWTQFRLFPLFEAGETVETVAVWFGEKGEIPVTVAEDVAVTLQPGELDTVRVVARFEEPIEAPVTRGMVVGQLVIGTADGGSSRIVDLVAAEDDPEASFLRALYLKAALLVGLES